MIANAFAEIRVKKDAEYDFLRQIIKFKRCISGKSYAAFLIAFIFCWTI